jgi:hypothetical protein
MLAAWIAVMATSCTKQDIQAYRFPHLQEVACQTSPPAPVAPPQLEKKVHSPESPTLRDP